MTEARCLHLNRVSGVLQRDLSRPAGENSLYSVELTTHICESCGQVELYCNSHREVCSWLLSTSKEQ